MGIKKLLALTFVGFASTAIAAAGPGLSYSATTAGVNALGGVISPVVFSYLHEVPIPDISAEGADLTNILFSIDEPAKQEDLIFSLNPPTNGITFDANNFVSHVTANFAYSNVIISVTGTAKIDITGIKATVGLDLASQQGTTGGLVPALKSRTIDLVISQDNIAIDLQGDGVDEIADIVKPVIRSIISNQVTAAIKAQLPDIINNDVNQDIAAGGSQYKFEDLPLVFDLALTQTAEVSAKGYVAGGLNGTFFNPDVSTAIPYSPVAIPNRDDAGKDFQLFLTDYTVNTLLYARYLAQQDDDLSDYIGMAGLESTTDSLSAAIPQLLTKYGPGVPVEVHFQFTKEVPTFQFTTESATLQGSNIITLVAKGEKAVVAQNEKGTVSFHLNIKDGKVYGKIESWSLGTITILSTTLGVDQATLVGQFNQFVKNAVDQTNANLAAGIEITPIEGVNVSDGEIKNYNGYVQLGVNLSQVAKTFELLQIIQ